MNTWKRWVIAALMALQAAASGAHGDFPPKHGGVMSLGGEVSFEVVFGAEGLTVFVEDHGDPIPTMSAQGSVRHVRSTDPPAVLVPDGGNRFLVPAFRARPGERLVLVVAFSDGTGGGGTVDVPCADQPACGPAGRP
jgi:hypothetical protein